LQSRGEGGKKLRKRARLTVLPRVRSFGQRVPCKFYFASAPVVLVQLDSRRAQALAGMQV
jgi:hypothetical protein